jgi:hypothetical protein
VPAKLAGLNADATSAAAPKRVNIELPAKFEVIISDPRPKGDKK